MESDRSMSVSSDAAVSQDDVASVIEMAVEPSYVSEIARKLIEADPAWDVSLNSAIQRVSSAVSMISERDGINVYDVGYGTDNMGQQEASPMHTLAEQDNEGRNIWMGYTLVYNVDGSDIRDSYQDYVNEDVDPIDKIELIETLSSRGNDVSKQAEYIMQDVMERQFRHYDTVEMPDYNDPGLDFYVEDEAQREWGLAIEVSVRYVNPIDSPYLNSKEEMAFERDADLLVIAPEFTDTLIEEYEDPDEPTRNVDPLSQMVHLHRVPPDEPTVYYPFAKTPDEIRQYSDSGNPVIIKDSKKAREALESSSNISDEYPIVDDDYDAFLDAVQKVNRDSIVMTESQYRNALREAIEPLLWEFLKPYKVEQFLMDMYWDKGLGQRQIGGLVDRTEGTIGEWMRKWGVMRRGTGAPELSEETVEIWKRMYRGQDPFPMQFSGYRIQAEYNRHPLWDLQDWEEWYNNTTEEERHSTMMLQDSHRENMAYTLMFDPQDRLEPSYTFIMSTLREEGVEIREPDEAPRVPYSAYPSKKALEYMLNRNEETIVDVSDEGE